MLAAKNHKKLLSAVLQCLSGKKMGGRKTYHVGSTWVFKFGVGVKALEHGIEADLSDLVEVDGIHVPDVDVIQDLREYLDFVLRKTW